MRFKINALYARTSCMSMSRHLNYTHQLIEFLYTCVWYNHVSVELLVRTTINI